MRLLSVLVATTLTLVATPAPAAHALSPIVAGFAYANQPSNPSYSLATGYEYNSTGLGIEIVRPVAGTYTVKFLGMGSLGGVPHVSARGSSSLCVVAAWDMAIGDIETVDVRCYNNAGVLVDSRFVVNFTNRKPVVAGYGYLWNDNPVPPPLGHTPAPAFSYDSAGLPIKVFRSAVGSYQVDLGAFRNDSPALWAAGYLHVTPRAVAARHCQALDPALAADPKLIEVRCYSDTGAAVDSQFILTYARGAAMLGGAGARTTATVAFSGPTATLRGWTNSYGGAPVSSEIVTGLYQVRIPNAGHPKGHAVASVMGTTTAYCSVLWWGPGAVNDEYVQVNCYDGNTGAPSPAKIINIAFIA